MIFLRLSFKFASTTRWADSTSLQGLAHREQEFMVRWGNSLSMTFRCSNGIRQGGQLSSLLYDVYTEYRWLKPSPPSNRCRVLCRRCLGKFTELCRWYGVTCTNGNSSSDTLLSMSLICWTSRHCIEHNENSMYAGPAKAITWSVLNKSQARKWGT